MTDPRAALADPLDILATILDENEYAPGPGYLSDRLAERGVLLVTEERLAAALVDVDVIGYWTDPHGYVMDSASAAAAIFAALSGEVTEPLHAAGSGHTADCRIEGKHDPLPCIGAP